MSCELCGKPLCAFHYYRNNICWTYCEECGKEFKYKPKKKDKSDFSKDFGFVCKNCNSEMQIEEDEE